MRKTTQVQNCARCGGDHSDLELRALDQPFAPEEARGFAWTHWMICPKNGQPIMVAIVDDSYSFIATPLFKLTIIGDELAPRFISDANGFDYEIAGMHVTFNDGELRIVPARPAPMTIASTLRQD